MQGARGAIRADPEQERRSLAEGSHLREHGEEVVEILAFADKDSRLALGAPDLDPVTRTGWDLILTSDQWAATKTCLPGARRMPHRRRRWLPFGPTAPDADMDTSRASRVILAVAEQARSSEQEL